MSFGPIKLGISIVSRCLQCLSLVRLVYITSASQSDAISFIMMWSILLFLELQWANTVIKLLLQETHYDLAECLVDSKVCSEFSIDKKSLIKIKSLPFSPPDGFTAYAEGKIKKKRQSEKPHLDSSQRKT